MNMEKYCIVKLDIQQVINLVDKMDNGCQKLTMSNDKLGRRYKVTKVDSNICIEENSR